MKKLLAIVLAMVLAIGCFTMAQADSVKKVKLSFLCEAEDTALNADMSDVPEGMKLWLERIKNLVPGYEIELEPIFKKNYTDDLGLIFASGDVPDILITPNLDFMQYYPLGFFYEGDLMPIVEQYGPNILSGCLEQDLEVCTLDGQLVAIPCENMYYKFPTCIRMDWVTKLGFEEKKTYTVSEISEICKAVGTQDPDGNGVNDTYGFGARVNGGDWSQTFMSLFGAFNGQPDQYYLDEEKAMAYPYNVSDDFRSALIYLNDLWKVGGIDPECFVLNYDQALLNAANGRAALYSGWWNVAYSIFAAGLAQLDPEARLEHIYIVSDDGTTEGVKSNGSIWHTAMISSECESVECAIALINFACSLDPRNQDWYYQLDDRDIDSIENAEELGLYVWYDNPKHEYYPDEDVLGLGEHWGIYYDDPDGAVSETTGEIVRWPYMAGGINYQQLSGSENQVDWYQYSYRMNPLANLFSTNAQRQQTNNAIARTAAQMTAEPEKYDKVTRSLYEGAAFQSNPENKPVYESMFYGYLVTDEDIEYGSALESYRTDWIVSFITGEKDPANDTDWQAYLNGYVGKGLQKVLDSYVAAYNEKNPNNKITAMQIGK